MLNITIMAGRLVEAPELRYTTNETPVTTCRIAVRRDFAKKGDDETTDFFDVVVWRETAEFVCKYFKKGSLIQIVGHFENRKWTDKHDQNRITAELIAEKVYFGESKGKEDNGDDFSHVEKETGRSGAVRPASGFPSDFDPFA